jgi:hypothetical protein
VSDGIDILRVLVVSVCRLECADSLPIDLPDNLIRSPFDGVCLEACLAAGIVVEGSAIVGGGLAFPKVVRLVQLARECQFEA